MLTLPEELLLLRASVGATVPFSVSGRVDLDEVRKPLAAARLIELVLVKRLAVEFQRRRVLMSDSVVLFDSTPTRDPLLDAIIEQIADSEARSCSHWIKRAAKDHAETAYWDRIVSKGLVRPDRLTRRAPREAVHAETLAALAERIRSVLNQPEAADLRDVALVTLTVHTQSIFGVLHRLEWSPRGLARSYMAQRSDDRRASRLLDTYGRSVTDAPGVADADRVWATMAAGAIKQFSSHVDQRHEGGGI